MKLQSRRETRLLFQKQKNVNRGIAEPKKRISTTGVDTYRRILQIDRADLHA